MKSSPRRASVSPVFLLTLLAAGFSLLLLAPLPPSASHSVGDGMRATPKTGNRDYLSRAAAPLAALDEKDYTPHLLAATYYSFKDGLRAALMLNNKGPHPLPVQVTIFGSGGERLDVPAVTVEGNSFRELDLAEQAGANPAFSEGSVQVFYRGHDLMLGAQVYLEDAGRSLVFEEKLLELDDSFASQRLESVWWLPSHKCEARLAVSNTGDAPLNVTAVVEGSRPKQKEAVTLALAPHETRAVDVLRDLVGTPGGQLMEAGGVSLSHDGAPGALVARLLIQDRGAGYSSWARFVDPRKGKSEKLHGAGLRVGSFAGERLTPAAVARNVGGAEAVVSGRVPYTLADGQTGVVALPELRLTPGEAKAFDLDKALRRGGVEQAAAAGLEFEHTGAAGSVVLSAQSVSESRNHVFHVPLWDIEAQKSSTGGYPWKVGGDISTVAYVKNVTDREQRYTWQLRHEGGTYSLGLRSIGPHETHAIDTRDLRDRQVRDEKGRTIPLDATRGQIH